jgi:hypothetical protein
VGSKQWEVRAFTSEAAFNEFAAGAEAGYADKLGVYVGKGDGEVVTVIHPPFNMRLTAVAMAAMEEHTRTYPWYAIRARDLSTERQIRHERLFLVELLSRRESWEPETIQ